MKGVKFILFSFSFPFPFFPKINIFSFVTTIAKAKAKKDAKKF